MTNKLVRFLYVLVIGLLFASFVGFGLAAFYKAPTPPDYPLALKYPAPATAPATDANTIAAQKQYDDAQATFTTDMSSYNLYASVILIGIAVVVMAVSLLGLEKVEVIGDGLTLGGVFTLLYGLGRGMTVANDVFRFMTVTAGLIIIILLAYLKFIRGPSNPTNSI